MPKQLQLNRSVEVSIHAQAADIEFTLSRQGDNDWQLHVIDTSEFEEEEKEVVLTLNNEQAGVATALFITGDFTSDDELNTQLYEIAESALKDVPQNLRIIP